MLHVLIFIVFLVYVESEGLGIDISAQLTATKTHCVDSLDFGDKYDSLGTNLENTLTSVTTLTTSRDTTTTTISDLTDDLDTLKASAMDYQPLQQELLAKLNEIKSIIKDTTTEMDILVAFAQSTPVVSTQITEFENTASAEIGNVVGIIDSRFTSSKNNFDTNFQGINDGLDDRFQEPKDYALGKITDDINNYVSSLSSFPADTTTEFEDASSIITSELFKSTGNINAKADAVEALIPNDFETSTHNVDTQSESTTNDITDTFEDLNDFIGDDLQKDLEGAIIALRQTIKSARDNMKWSLGLKIDYGFSAKEEGLNFDGSPSYGSDYNKESVLIELSEIDVYIIGTVGVLMNLVWMIMIVYLIVDYCIPKYKNMK